MKEEEERKQLAQASIRLLDAGKEALRVSRMKPGKVRSAALAGLRGSVESALNAIPLPLPEAVV